MIVRHYMSQMPLSNIKNLGNLLQRHRLLILFSFVCLCTVKALSMYSNKLRASPPRLHWKHINYSNMTSPFWFAESSGSISSSHCLWQGMPWKAAVTASFAGLKRRPHSEDPSPLRSLEAAAHLAELETSVHRSCNWVGLKASLRPLRGFTMVFPMTWRYLLTMFISCPVIPF